MADISDVLDVLTAQTSGYVYPNGTGQASVAGCNVRVYPGWPTASSLDQDLQVGTVNVSIFPSGTEMNRTRYRPKQNVMSVVTPTLTLTVVNNVVTIGGAMPSPFTPHNLALLVGGVAFIYPVQSTDSLTTIATALATLLAASYPGTTSTGPVITMPSGTTPIVARVGTTGQVTTEWERQAQRIQITVWAPDPTTRNLVAAAIKTALSQVTFLTMPDGFGARIKTAGGFFSDALEKAKTYRRDLIYEVEYATTVTEQIATVVAVQVKYETQNGTPLVTKTY